MKEIKGLKPYFRDLKSDVDVYMRTIRKCMAFERWLSGNLPFGIKGQYSFSPDLGEDCVRLFIYLDKDDEGSTVNIIKWMSQLKKQRFEIEKFWREEAGYYAYRAERKYNYKYKTNSFLILIENTANIDGCVITKKRKMRYIYETNCEKERVTM